MIFFITSGPDDHNQKTTAKEDEIRNDKTN